MSAAVALLAEQVAARPDLLLEAFEQGFDPPLAHPLDGSAALFCIGEALGAPQHLERAVPRCDHQREEHVQPVPVRTARRRDQPRLRKSFGDVEENGEAFEDQPPGGDEGWNSAERVHRRIRRVMVVAALDDNDREIYRSRSAPFRGGLESNVARQRAGPRHHVESHWPAPSK